ncbi:hypothetical protein DZK26_12250 [Wenzhouxiangella sp. 15190]|nr:hypothetical protein DZK26_12250 [Wenzhouxiangella sp. 15190]
MRYLLLTLTFVLVGHASATGEINVLTDLQSPFPPGCVAVSLPQESASAENELYDEDVFIPSVEEDQPAAQVRVQIWRTGCHDEGFSVVMVRLEKVSGGPVLVPRAFAEAGNVELPGHQAQLIRHPAVGGVGASGNDLVGATTYMLGVDPFPLNPDNDTTFGPTEYNDEFTLELFWGDYARTDPSEDFRLFTIFEYEPQIDPTQKDYPILHGRMSGQYTVEGRPFSGVVLQIGEVYNPDGPDTNSVSVLFFTYINGAPTWVIGADSNLEPGFDMVTLDMLELSGGQFITSPPGRYDEDDVTDEFIGTMTLEALDCNTLLIGYNFSESGLGTGSFEAERLINLAGYACNPWR